MHVRMKHYLRQSEFFFLFYNSKKQIIIYGGVND